MSWPRTDNPRTNFVTLRLTTDETADVDWLAALPANVGPKGPNRSLAVRNAVERVIAYEKRKAAKDKARRENEQRSLSDD